MYPYFQRFVPTPRCPQTAVTLTEGVDTNILGSLPAAAPLNTPSPIDLGTIDDWHRKNQIITDWYHQIDQQMSSYLGDPELPSWARFAKHASYNAGLQLCHLQEALEAIDSLLRVKTCCADVFGDDQCAALWKLPKEIFCAVKQISHLFLHEGLVRTGLLTALSRAGLGNSATKDLIELTVDGQEQNHYSIRMIWLGIKHFPELLKILPVIRTELSDLFITISESNQDIYNFMAPRLAAFLSSKPQPSVINDPMNDPSGEFLARALGNYTAARSLAMQADQHPELAAELLATRQELVAKANLIATFGEQLYRVQPRFEKIAATLQVISGQMTFSSPLGIERLLQAREDLTWANIYNRMGIDPDTAPSCPSIVSPDEFPELYELGHPKGRGTIGELLQRGITDTTVATKLKICPKPVPRTIC